MALDAIDLENQRIAQIWRFTRILALVCVLLAALPSLIGWISKPPGSLYLGIQTNLDDHMVYAAWMRQAMDGKFFFDNRFTVDWQPGLTVHLYFYVLGLVAKLLGIPLTMALARLALTYLFVIVLGKFFIRLKIAVFPAKYMLLIGCFGGGLGFLAWERFGEAFVNGPPFLAPLFGGREPIDVWQPEAFVFPSMLTNGLFLASLCLIIWTLQAVIDARDSWQPVLKGAVSYGLLMNIHSYDVLLIALVLVGFLVTQAVRKRVGWVWVVRALVIGAGAVPAALWFLHVLAEDAVFRERAATLTYSPNFRQILLGILPMIVLAGFATWKSSAKYRIHAFLGYVGLLLALTVASSGHDPSGYFLNLPAWIVLLLATLVLIGLMATDDDSWNIAWSWAMVGLVAVYFPALFQRKLAMGLAIPWSMIAAYGLFELLKPLDRSTRNLVATLTLFVTSASSILWFQRETSYIRSDVGRTAVHSVYFTQDTGRIIDILNKVHGRCVVLAMPGVPNPTGPAEFKTPQMTDLNPVLSGLCGVYTYAGHWSETPDYARRRSEATLVYFATTSPERRAALLDRIKPDYVVAPNLNAYPEIVSGDDHIPLADLSYLGETVYRGNQLMLIKTGGG